MSRTCRHHSESVQFRRLPMRNTKRNSAHSSSGPPMSSTLTFDIPRDPTAPGEARRAIERIGDRIAPDVVPDVKLLVSELITNSVKYGGDGEVTLRVDASSPRKLRVEVIDQGAGFVPVARNRPATEVGGWGLHLVQTLSDRWGVYEGSTHVWFEIDRTNESDRARFRAA
jgi:anti-sigma regulatory factor (Ser/Thr protein kinase)